MYDDPSVERPPAAEFAEGWTGDDRTTVTDDPASGVRLVEYSSFLIGDIHHMDEFRRPAVLDLTERKTILDLRPCCTSFDCRFEDGLVRLAGRRNARPPSKGIDLILDVRGDRFRDGDGSWQPLAAIQSYAADHFLDWREVQHDFDPKPVAAWRAALLRALRLIWLPLAVGFIAFAFYDTWTGGGFIGIHGPSFRAR